MSIFCSLRHIVGENSEQAQVARDILAKHDIDLNGKDNGVYLPNRNNTDDMLGILHNGRHPKEYIETVNNRIRAADESGGKQGVLDVLKDMGNQLKSADRWTPWKSVLKER